MNAKGTGLISTEAPGGIFQPLHEGSATGFLVPQKHEGLLLTRDGLPRFALRALRVAPSRCQVADVAAVTHW